VRHHFGRASLRPQRDRDARLLCNCRRLRRRGSGCGRHDHPRHDDDVGCASVRRCRARGHSRTERPGCDDFGAGTRRLRPDRARACSVLRHGDRGPARRRPGRRGGLRRRDGARRRHRPLGRLECPWRRRRRDVAAGRPAADGPGVELAPSRQGGGAHGRRRARRPDRRLVDRRRRLGRAGRARARRREGDPAASLLGLCARADLHEGARGSAGRDEGAARLRRRRPEVRTGRPPRRPRPRPSRPRARRRRRPRRRGQPRSRK
jgi:hypothetical protein